jgi:hypothetical protein
LDRIRKRNLFAAIVDVHASAGIAGNKIARGRAEAADEICPPPLMSTPGPRFATAAVPLMSVPMKFP